MSDDDRLGPPEFCRQEAQERRAEMRRHTLRWSLLFAAIFAFVFFTFWWAGAAVHFGASRVETSTVATWRVSGTLRDARTGAPAP